MERYTLHDAQQHLQQLIDEALHGKSVFILDDNNRAVLLVPVASADILHKSDWIMIQVPIHPVIDKSKARKAGSARGQIIMSPDFDAPLEDFNEYME